MTKLFYFYFNILVYFSFSRFLNLIALYTSYVYSLFSNKPIHKGEPWSLSVETGTSCNLSCLECPSGQNQFSRPTGYMSFSDFKTIISKQKKYLIWLILYFQGEPFLNKDFFKMIAYANAQKIITTTSTNGHFLKPENAEKTVKSGLKKIIISLDGLDQESYEKYRVGGDFNTVINGIKNLQQARKKLKSASPYIVVQFIVFKTNEHQIKHLKKLKRELNIDKIELKTAQIYSASDKNQLIPKTNKYRRYKQNKGGDWEIKNRLPNHCLRMWQGAVVTWDGNIAPCCYDKDVNHKMGNLLESSFKNIKKNRKYHSFRNQIFSDRSKINICKNCNESL